MQKETQQHESYYSSAFQYTSAIVPATFVFLWSEKIFSQGIKVAKTSADFILKTRDTSKK